jgi:hypothetical protein
VGNRSAVERASRAGAATLWVLLCLAGCVTDTRDAVFVPPGDEVPVAAPDSGDGAGGDGSSGTTTGGASSPVGDSSATSGSQGADTSGTTMSDPGASGGDTGGSDVAAAGAGGTDPSTGDPAPVECPEDCPAVAAEPAASQQLVIEVLDVGGSRIVIRNVSGGALDLQGWEVVKSGAARTELSGMLGADETLEVPLAGLFALGANDEIAIYAPGMQTPGRAPLRGPIHAYVRWGSGLAGVGGLESAAAGAGIWTGGDSVALCGAHTAAVATGDVTSASGWRSVDATTCL